MIDRTKFIPELMERLKYNTKTGEMIWKDRPLSDFNGDERYAPVTRTSWQKRYLGKPAFNCTNKMGHKTGRYKNVDLYAHHVIWALHHGYWPTMPIAHENGNPSDNRIDNLSMKSQSEVAKNQSMNANNKSGQLGVYKRKDTGKWVARIGGEGSEGYRYLGGAFDNFADAAMARQIAEADIGYHENHGKRPSRSL